MYNQNNEKQGLQQIGVHLHSSQRYSQQPKDGSNPTVTDEGINKIGHINIMEYFQSRKLI